MQRKAVFPFMVEEELPLKDRNVKTQYRTGTVWILSTVLVVCLLLSLALLGDRLRQRAAAERNVIELIPTAYRGEVDLPAAAPARCAARFGAGMPSAAAPARLGVFTAEDGHQIWSTETDIDIFRITYDETGEVNVISSNTDKLIAPGTTDTYSFTLKNNGSFKLKYTVRILAWVTPSDVALPVLARVTGRGGAYLAGGPAAWVPVLDIDGLTETSTLQPHNNAIYSLDWQWPFESGNDAYDTLLGNLAVGEDLTLTIRIETIAEEDTSGGGGGGGGDITIIIPDDPTPDDPSDPDDPGSGEHGDPTPGTGGDTDPGTGGGSGDSGNTAGGNTDSGGESGEDGNASSHGIPKTGDDSLLLVYALLMIAATAGLILLLILRRKTGEEETADGVKSNPEK